MKILFYYWMQYNDVNSRGGGVQVYLRNVINGLRKRDDIEIYTLSSGTAYDLSGKCRIEKLSSDGKIKRYQIVNSPMLAPSKASFYNQDTYIHDDNLKKILMNFINELGGVDVIHFQSLEGLTLKCLELKKELPCTKFILSLHNYQVFCPQVNLWKNDSVSCDDFHEGKDCLTCLGNYPQTDSLKKYYLFDFYLRKIGLARYSRPLMNRMKSVYGKISNGEATTNKQKTGASFMNAEKFRDFRLKNIESINLYIDKVLCVSNRVRNIAIHMGICPKIAVTNYIGSKFAETQKTYSQYPYNKDDILKIAYMGYMRRDKGFYFLLDTMEKMPAEIAKKIAVVIAARYDDMDAVKRLEKLNDKFADVALYNGYTHKEIPQITHGVHLGVVPVLWEDNLPQVAIEFKAMGIPVLASNKGGASELSASTYFSFQSGNYKDFIEHVRTIIDNPDIINDYWDKQMLLKTMDQHIQELFSIYLK